MGVKAGRGTAARHREGSLSEVGGLVESAKGVAAKLAISRQATTTRIASIKNGSFACRLINYSRSGSQ